MLLGEWLIYLLGYETGTEEVVPLGPALLASTPALLLMLAPAGGATWFGMRARKRGREGGLIPAIIGATICIGLVILNLPGLLFGH